MDPIDGTTSYCPMVSCVPSGTAAPASLPLASFLPALGSGFLFLAAFGSSAYSWTPLIRSSISFLRSSLSLALASWSLSSQIEYLKSNRPSFLISNDLETDSPYYIGPKLIVLSGVIEYLLKTALTLTLIGIGWWISWLSPSRMFKTKSEMVFVVFILISLWAKNRTVMTFSVCGWSSSCSGSTVKISLVSFFFLVKLYLIGYLPSFLMVMVFSFGSPTLTAPKSRTYPSSWLAPTILTPPIVTVGEILKASALILMTLVS